MLNPFYWYSVIWTTVLFLYNCGWSDYNKPLKTDLMIFLTISILISFACGYINRESFQYRELNISPNEKNNYTWIILLVGLIEFFYAKNIPVVSILRGSRSYGDFQGIPLVHTFLENAIIFYSACRYYCFLETQKKKYLREVVMILSIIVLMFHKGSLLFCIFALGNLTVAKILKKNIFTIRTAIKIGVVMFLVLYLNGVLSNLRTGYGWNDNHVIFFAGAINSSWPKFLPMQLAWAYSYITSPLANLNLTSSVYNGSIDFIRLIVTTVPIFIAKRLFPQYMIDGINEVVLHSNILNASTGYVESYVTAGIFGVFYFYLTFIVVLLVFTTKLKKNKYDYSSPIASILSMISAFLFFYNTLTTAATSLLIYYMLFSMLLNNKVFTFNKHY